MRVLQNQDMYLLSQIADKMDIKFPDLPATAGKSKKEVDDIRNDYGVKCITLVFRNVYKAQNEINQLIANVSEKSVEEVKTMSLGETIRSFSEILKQEGVLDFFK